MTKYTFSFPIGDWSNDGHGRCDWYRVTSDKPVQDAREAHFKCEEVLGFNIGEICGDYEDDTIDPEFTKTLIEKGIVDMDWLNEHTDPDYDDPDRKLPSSESLFLIWIKILNFIDSSLNLEYKEDTNDTINFYGFDDKGRHLETPGYGLFE